MARTAQQEEIQVADELSRRKVDITLAERVWRDWEDRVRGHRIVAIQERIAKAKTWLSADGLMDRASDALADGMAEYQIALDESGEPIPSADEIIVRRRRGLARLEAALSAAIRAAATATPDEVRQGIWPPVLPCPTVTRVLDLRGVSPETVVVFFDADHDERVLVITDTISYADYRGDVMQQMAHLGWATEYYRGEKPNAAAYVVGGYYRDYATMMHGRRAIFAQRR